MSLYTPWSEEWRDLHQRTRGRDDSVSALVNGATQLTHGGHPLPLYFFGPRGIGKSHVVIDGIGQVRDALIDHGLSIVTLGEDAAEVGDADVLWSRLSPTTRPAWMGWDRPAASGPERAVVVIEGLDRQLKALGKQGRKRFRALLDAHPDVWVVATGARLTEELTAREEAFFGAFQSIPILPLGEEDASDLLDHEAGEEIGEDPRWPARRAAIVVLAGGNARALVALGRAVRAGPGQEVARRLLAVLDEFTPHYQLRFRDLSPQEQQLVEILTQAPRDIGPTEIAARLGSLPASWSTCAHRLDELGVVRIRQEGRLAFYRIAEPLFRYWLEFRSAPWGDTRVAWLGELLELVLGPAELVEAWTDAPEEVLRTAALRAIKRKPEGRQLAWSQRLKEVELALEMREGGPVEAAVQAAADVVPGPAEAWALARRLALSGFAAAGRRLGAPLIQQGSHTLGTLLASRGDAGELRGLLADLGSNRTWDGVGPMSRDARALVVYLDLAASEIDPRGLKWSLKAAERRALRDVPYLRARLARHGRRPTHAPLLDEGDLLQARIDASSPDLPELLAATVAREQFTAAARLVAVMRDAPEARLPWCPWPGRRLPLDPDGLLALIARHPTVAAMTWLAGTVGLQEDRFATLLDRPELALLPVSGLFGSRLQLALSAVALARPAPFEGLRAALKHPTWSALFERVDLLVRQLREGERGPLHPELARVYEIVRPPR